MKGIGVEIRRCVNCENMQEVLAIKGTETLFFRCDKCHSETFIQDTIDNLTIERFMMIDTT